jgi:hypothetical protein
MKNVRGFAGAPLLGCSSIRVAELENALVEFLDIEDTSAARARRIAPVEGHMCR